MDEDNDVEDDEDDEDQQADLEKGGKCGHVGAVNRRKVAGLQTSASL
jgi:hypothetical protein